VKDLRRGDQVLYEGSVFVIDGVYKEADTLRKYVWGRNEAGDLVNLPASSVRKISPLELLALQAERLKEKSAELDDLSFLRFKEKSRPQ
jgi:hypothetical protein